MRQETDGVLLESFLIYEPEHEATWYKEGEPLLGGLDYDERYQVKQVQCSPTPKSPSDLFTRSFSLFHRPSIQINSKMAAIHHES